MPYNNAPNGMSPGFGPNGSQDDLKDIPLPPGTPPPGAEPNVALNSQQQLSVFFPTGNDPELESVLKPLMENNNPPASRPNGISNLPSRANPHFGQTARQHAHVPAQMPPGQPGVGPFPVGSEPDPASLSGRLRPLPPITATAPLPMPVSTPSTGTVPVAIAKASTTGPLGPSPLGANNGNMRSGMHYSVTHNTGPFNAYTSPQIVQNVASRILSGIPATAVLERTPDIEQMLAGRFMSALSQVPGPIPANSQPILFKLVVDEILGLGPLEPLMQDISVTEVMVNGPQQVWVERAGNLVLSDVKFMNEEHLMRTASRIAIRMGRKLDRKWPMLDGRLPDGSRVNIVGPPVALHGTTVTIRKQAGIPLTMSRLVEQNTLTPELASFLRLCVLGRLNIIVAGGSGSGKTTLLNALASYIPDDDRIVTVEEAAEMRLEQRHVVALETRPTEYDTMSGSLLSSNTGEITLRHLVNNALRMRANRLLVGELMGGEVLDLVAAMNTGHDGFCATMHASTPRDAVSHLESMALMSGTNIPARSLRESVATAVDLIVQIARLRDGSRKVIYVTEVRGMEGDSIALKDIFRWHEFVDDEKGTSSGFIEPTGHTPRFVYRLQDRGILFDQSIFGS